MKSTRRVSVLIAVALAVCLGAPAQAAPSAPPTTYGGPYESARVWTFTDCQAGAECTLTGSATADGAAEAGVRYSREVSTTGDELTSSHARITQTVQLPRKAGSAKISLTWRIDEAASAASAQTGRVFTGTYVSARAWCSGKCEVKPVDEHVTFCGVDLVRPACDPGRPNPACRSGH